MNKYTLVNEEGCIMDTTEATNFTNARKYFTSKFEGKYKICCDTTGETKNVILK